MIKRKESSAFSQLKDLEKELSTEAGNFKTRYNNYNLIIKLSEELGEKSIKNNIQKRYGDKIEIEKRKLEKRYNLLKSYNIVEDMKLNICLTAVMAVSSSLFLFCAASKYPDYSNVSVSIPHANFAEAAAICGLVGTSAGMYFGFEFVADVGKYLEMKYLQRQLTDETRNLEKLVV